MMADIEELREWFEREGSFDTEHWELFLAALESGVLSVVSQDGSGAWQVHAWVKAAILSGFRRGGLHGWPWPEETTRDRCAFFDRPAFPPRRFHLEDGIRMVPGGSSVRRGAHVAKGVIIMPPSYINVGAWIGEGTMVDSHVLVGSCARIGAGVHLSAGVQIGGVLEPPQASPVIVEDHAFIGGLCGLFEGVVVRHHAVLAPGVILSKGTRIYDLVEGRELAGEVPPRAVVVPGTRPARGSYAQEHGLSLAAPCIVKYRDEKTDSALELESALRV